MRGAVRSRVVTSFVLATAVCAFLFLAADADARRGKKRVRTEREVSQQYSVPAGAFLVSVDLNFCVGEGSCLTFIPDRSERYVEISISDGTGTPAPFRVEINGIADVFCGETTGSLSIEHATAVNVSAFAGAVPDCPGVATEGTATATFSNLP